MFIYADISRRFIPIKDKAKPDETKVIPVVTRKLYITWCNLPGMALHYKITYRKVDNSFTVRSIPHPAVPKCRVQMAQLNSEAAVTKPCGYHFDKKSDTWVVHPETVDDAFARSGKPDRIFHGKRSFVDWLRFFMENNDRNEALKIVLGLCAKEVQV